MGARKPNKDQNNAAELLPDPAAADNITKFFSALGAEQSAAVTVYQIDPRNRLRRSFLFTIPDATELTGAELMQQVLKEYGPGEYMAEGRDDDSGQILFKPRFEVGTFAAGRGVQIPGPLAASPAPAPAAKPGDTSSELAAAINRQSALLERVLAGQAQPSAIDRLRELKELRELFAPAAPAAPALDFAKVLELVTGVLSLRDTLSDGAGDGGGPLSVMAKALAPALQRIAERTLEAAPALPPPATPAGAPSRAGDTSAELAPAGDENMQGVLLRVYVGELVGFAEKGLEAKAAAARVLQTLAGFPVPTQEAVIDWLNDEELIANLTAIEPKAAAYAAWLGEVVDIVIEAATEPDDAAPPAPPANGAARPSVG